MPESGNTPLNIALRIRTLRLRLKLSQQQFADLTNVPLTLFKQWESGALQPPDSYWQRLLAVESESWHLSANQRSMTDRIAEARAAYTTQRDHVDDKETVWPDFRADPDIVRTFVEGQRLAYGYLFNPTFATETSRRTSWIILA